ncbi:hypothetical protein [Streptomyces sp. NPDC058583]
MADPPRPPKYFSTTRRILYRLEMDVPRPEIHAAASKHRRADIA